MSIIQSKTPISIAKADDDTDIHDAGFDALASMLVRLFRAAGWEPNAAVSELQNELNAVVTEINFAADVQQRAVRK